MKMFICRVLLSLLLLFSNSVFAGHYTQLWEQVAELIFGNEDLLEQHHSIRLEQAIKDGEKFYGLLDEDGQHLIHMYTIHPDHFNAALKQGADIDSGLSEVFFAKAMREVLWKLDSKNYITYRGGVYPTGVYGNGFKVGDVIYNNAFTSSSLSAKIAKQFSKIKYPKRDGFDNIIHVFESRTGTNITSFSETFKWEAEILLHPETMYEIKKIEERNGVIFVVSSEIEDIPEDATVRHIYTGEELTFDCD